MKPSAISACMLALAALAAACGERSQRQQPAHAVAPWDGDVANGRLLLRQYGCGGCHEIPGVPGARGAVGPPLNRIASRVYLAGVLPNSPQQLSNWIRAPQAIRPGTAMPDMQVSAAQARDMVAYLYTLK
jgi:cytochrome c2